MQFNNQIIDEEDVVQMISPLSSIDLKIMSDEHSARKYDIPHQYESKQRPIQLSDLQARRR
jgi:hypothetical protein